MKLFNLSEFDRNSFTMVKGNVLAQLIPLLVAPILSRIYSPDDFGLLALYASIAMVLGAVANMRYELAIVLPSSDKEAIHLTLLCIIISASLAILTLVVVLVSAGSISEILNNNKINDYLYLLPLSVLLIGGFNALNYYNTRIKNFKQIAGANIAKAASGNALQLGIGTLTKWPGGLILGQVLAHFFGNVKMLKTFLESKQTILETRKSDLKAVAKKYIDFPKISVWGIFLNTLSQQATNLFIAFLYTSASVGQYYFAYRYMGLPSSLIGNSIGQVYMQRLSEVRDFPEMAIQTFRITLLKLIAIGLVLFVPLYFLVEDLFELIFGSQWRIAGIYARIMIPLFFMRFVFAPLSLSNIVFEKQLVALLSQLSLFLVAIAVYLFTYFHNTSIELLIVNLTYAWVATYCCLLLVVYFVIKGVIK